MSWRGRLNAWVYHSRQRRWLYWPVSGWIKSLPLLLLVAAWWRGASAWLLILLLALLITIYLVYWLVERSGYVSFAADSQAPPPTSLELPADHHKISLYATGVFAVNEREAYLLERPATYWRVPLGEHAIMVEERPGRFLYQFFRGETLLAVRPGHFLFGAQPRPALALDFLNQWGPAMATGDTHYYVGGNSAGRQQKRTIYFTFDRAADRRLVWRNLLRDMAAVASETR